MTFLSGLFLAGFALVAVPWWLHRRQTHADETRPFSSLFLMRASEAPVHTRKRLQYRWLLALRCLLLLAACLAFAEPVLRFAGAGTAGQTPLVHQLLVLDTSLSMAAEVGNETTFERARRAAREVINDAPDGTRFGLVTAADALEVVEPLTGDRGRLKGALAGLETGHTRLANAGLVDRLSALADTLTGPDERLVIHVFSDFQDSAMPDQFNALVSGSRWPVTLHPVVEPGERRANRAVTGVRLDNGAIMTSLRAFDAPDTAVDLVLIRDELEVDRQSVFLPGDGTASAAFRLPQNGGREPASWSVRIDTPDALAADNIRRVPAADTVTQTLPVLTLDRKAFEYVRAAVQAAAPRFKPEQVDDRVAGEAPVVAVLGSSALGPDTMAGLNAHVDAGGAVLMTIDETTRAAGQLPLVDLPIAADRFRQRPRGAIVQDHNHPVLAGIPDWTDLTVFRSLQSSEVSGEVIVALDDGTPLLTEYRLGAGRLMLLGTALDPAWSTLAISAPFPRFMANLLGYLAEDLLPQQAIAGEPFAVPAQNVQLFDAGGDPVLDLAETVGRPTVALAEPGLYRLQTPGSSRTLVVNPDPAESAMPRADADLLASWQATLDRVAPSSIDAATPELQSTQAAVDEVPLAPFLLLLLLVAVLAEPLWANLFAGRDARMAEALS